MPPLELHLGDVLRLRKEHPCGSFDFEVVRLGADIGLHCTRCGRRILLPRSTLETRIAQFVSRGATHELPSDLGPSSPAPPGLGSGPPAPHSPDSTPPPDRRTRP